MAVYGATENAEAGNEVMWDPGDVAEFPVKAAEKILKGSLVSVDANGLAVNGADTAGQIFQGVALAEADNTNGSNGSLKVAVRRRGTFRFEHADTVTQANVGDNVFLEDYETVDFAANTDNDIYCGIIMKVESPYVWIDIDPAIRQADVATHIADTSAAHAASAVSIADSGSFTAATQVEAALAEIYQDIKSIQKIIQIPLGQLTLEDGTAIGKFADGDSATPGYSQESNKEVVLRWNNHGTPTKVTAFGIPLPPDLDPAADAVVHWRAKMSGTTDTPVLEHEVYLGAGDTDCAGTDDEIDGAATLTEYTATIGNADITGAPQEMTLIFGPKAGELGTDDLLVYSVWIEYKGKALTS